MAPPRYTLRMRWVIRSAAAEDADALARMFDGFAKGHPSEKVARPAEAIAKHYFGPSPMGRILVAEVAARPVGLGIWRKAYDYFWNMEYGEVTGLYVEPDFRGVGVAVALIAAICAEVRASGGEFLHGHYSGEPQTRLYERFVAGHASRAGYLSARAFHRMANLAGADGRTLAARLPAPEWNRDTSGITEENRA